MIVLIDNYDSFVYNLYQFLAETGQEVRVARNDRISPEEVLAMAMEHRTYPVYGLQFHPESVMTPEGYRMIENFIRWGSRPLL